MCELSELPPHLLAGKPNTDDNAFVEYRAPIDLFEVGRRDMLAGRGEQLTSQIPCSGVVPFAGDLSPRDVALWRAEGLARRGRFDWAERAIGWLADMGRTDTADSLMQVIEILKVDARSRAISLEITSLHRSGRAVEAERRLVDLLAQAPDDPVVNFNLGLLLMQTGRIDAADSLFALVIDQGVGSPVVRSNNNRGIIAVRRGDVEEGIAFFHRARTLRADLPESYLYEAQILDETGRLDESIAVIERGLEALPGHTTLLQAHQKLLAKKSPSSLAPVQGPPSG
jgi:Flp pilus assembly protein TadD